MASFPLMVGCLVVLSHLDFVKSYEPTTCVWRGKEGSCSTTSVPGFRPVGQQGCGTGYDCYILITCIPNRFTDLIPSKGQCPLDWTEVDGQCFHVPKAPTVRNPDNLMQLDWVAARDYCLTLEADLAQPNNLLDIAEYLRTIFGLDDFDRIWLGGSDAHITGIWRWNNGTIIPLPIKNKDGIVTNHNGWKDGQPDSRNGINQDCLYMMCAAVFGANVMGDEDCQDKQHFVCERTPEKIGCVYGFKCYEDGAILNDACLAFECTEGNWKYLGKSIQECGSCTVKGVPHITTYETHNLIDDPDITKYESPYGYESEYAISQQGKSYQSLFGVYANFTDCFMDVGQKKSCVSRVNYTEPGVDVQLILPAKGADFLLDKLPAEYILYCSTAPLDDPQCATTIKVNGETRVIADGGSVTSFSGTDGTVLVFKDGKCNSKNCQIYVVGSKGITISLRVNPSFGKFDDNMYQLDILPTRSLHNQLFGLCDTYNGNGTEPDYYTSRDGAHVTTWNNATRDDFIQSWSTAKIGTCSCAYRDNTDLGGGCIITKPAPADQACRCIPDFSIFEWCDGTVVNCKNPSSAACTDPKDGYESCLQGKGNCGGYDIIPILPPTTPTATTTG